LGRPETVRIAADRHTAQTDADRQRRITESFSKAIEQLGSDKVEVRLGGIYTLERVSRESKNRYWPVMETLTAFIRERTRSEAERLEKPLEQRKAERAHRLWEEARKPEGRSEDFWRTAVEQEISEEPPATDIAAVLTVVHRRSEKHRALEIRDKRRLDLRRAVLRHAYLPEVHLESAELATAHLEGAILRGARLEGADAYKVRLESTDLREAHFEGTFLREAHLEYAKLDHAHLEGAILYKAHLQGATLLEAHLERAHLSEAQLQGAIMLGAYLEGADLRDAHLQDARLLAAHFEGTNLQGAHLERADLRVAQLLKQEQIDAALGDVETKLPRKLTRPAHWSKSLDEQTAHLRSARGDGDVSLRSGPK
jgi:uncharacterized protein YjbI with pentapeptide repeats